MWLFHSQLGSRCVGDDILEASCSRLPVCSDCNVRGLCFVMQTFYHNTACMVAGHTGRLCTIVPRQCRRQAAEGRSATLDYGIHQSDMDGISPNLNGLVAMRFQSASLLVANGVASKHCQPVCMLKQVRTSVRSQVTQSSRDCSCMLEPLCHP